MSREVGDVICWLEEVLYQTICGYLSFQAYYLAGNFMYQMQF